jgi:hypothetical protein
MPCAWLELQHAFGRPDPFSGSLNGARVLDHLIDIGLKQHLATSSILRHDQLITGCA